MNSEHRKWSELMFRWYPAISPEFWVYEKSRLWDTIKVRSEFLIYLETLIKNFIRFLANIVDKWLSIVKFKYKPHTHPLELINYFNNVLACKV